MGIFEWGEPRDKGNLVGIQTRLESQDFRSLKTIRQKLRTYLTAARGHDLLNSMSIVTFGEYLGTWLLALEEYSLVYKIRKQRFALLPIALRRTAAMLKLFIDNSETSDKMTEAFFRLKSQDMAEAYVALFSDLAREFGVTVVAGSIVLPHPSVVNQKISVGTFPLYNCTGVFRPDGSICDDLVVKQNTIGREAEFTSKGEGKFPVFDTPAGKMGVLICADSWHPDCYLNFSEPIDFIVVPGYISQESVFDSPWKGYDSTSSNVKFDARDIEKLSERDAWHKYALPGQISASGARAGLTVFSRGTFWDVGSDGQSFGFKDGTLFEPPRDAPSEAICSLWL